MTAFNAVLPVLTLVLGYLGTLATEGIRDRRVERSKSTQRRLEFELENLTALGPLLDTMLANATTVCNLSHSQSPLARDRHAAETAHSEFRTAWQQADRRVPLIFDESLRTEARRAINTIAIFEAYRGPYDGGQAAWKNAHVSLQKVHELAGERIRTLFQADVARIPVARTTRRREKSADSSA